MKDETPNPSLTKRLRKALSSPQQASKEYKAILETFLIGSFVLVAVMTVLLLYSYFALENYYVADRLIVCAVALLYLSMTYGVRIKRHYSEASQLLIIFYFIIATIVMLGWGVDTTFSQLMLAITIVLSGILLGSRAVIVTAGLSVSAMIGTQLAVSQGVAPWFNDAVAVSSFGDVWGMSALLGVLALISVLAGKHTQELRAQEQQTAILLERRVQESTAKLKNMQLEKMQELYKFAEIGQLSAALLHDIANQLTVLNVDLADLKSKPRGQAVKHLEESIEYIEQAISQARQQLQLKDEKRTFDVRTCISDSLKLPHFEHTRQSITLNLPTEPVLLYGESLWLSNIIVVLMRNAIEAYPRTTTASKRVVTITMEATNKHIIIRVADQGAGIPPELRKNLFAPLRSTKKDGLGIGLFIAKKLTESHFAGSLTLNDKAKQTEFVLTLPQTQAKK